MTIFLILAPFAGFALLMLVTSAAISLFAGAAFAAAIIGYEVSQGRSIKMLAAGALIMFSSLGCYITLIDGDWSATEVRLAVDIGTLGIALASIAIRAPFTLQYAREVVDVETMKMPGFMRANYIITWAWTGAFVLMLIANLLMIYMPSLPARHWSSCPQQRGLFHQMVPGVPAGEICYSPRRRSGFAILIHQLRANRSAQSASR